MGYIFVLDVLLYPDNPGNFSMGFYIDIWD